MIHITQSSRKFRIIELDDVGNWRYVADMIIKPNLSIPESYRYSKVCKCMAKAMENGI